MQEQKRVLNPQVLLELVCIVAFALSILFLTVSGGYRAYVTPRMVPYFFFAAGIMLVWAVAGAFRLFRPQHRTRAAHCLVLAVPVLLLLLPHSAIGAGDLSSGYAGSGVQRSLTGKTNEPAPSSSLPAAVASPSAWTWQGDTAQPQPTPDDAATDEGGQGSYSEYVPAGLDRDNKTITVSDEYFSLWLSELPMNLDEYEGYRITIKGFVFRDKQTMKDNEFVPARLMMSCCSADLAPIGFICIYDQAPTLQDDSWVTVEGVVHKGYYEGYEEPQIQVTGVTPAEKVDEYIFP